MGIYPNIKERHDDRSLITEVSNGEIADTLGMLRMVQAMQDKLAKKRAEGYGGWNHPNVCSTGMLMQMLANHLEKGDMVDVANFAMMIWNRENPHG